MPSLLSVVGEAINATRNGDVLHAEQGLCWSVTACPSWTAASHPQSLCWLQLRALSRAEKGLCRDSGNARAELLSLRKASVLYPRSDQTNLCSFCSVRGVPQNSGYVLERGGLPTVY